MAAEPLTKARLVQLISLMAVLLIAFIWKTLVYYQNQDVYHCPNLEQICTLVINQHEVKMIRESQGQGLNKREKIRVFSHYQTVGLFYINNKDQVIPLFINAPLPASEKAIEYTYDISQNYLNDKNNAFILVFHDFQIDFSLNKLSSG